MTKETNRKEENVINVCILLSKDICILQTARICNRQLKTFLLRSLRTLRCTGYTTHTENELDQIIDDHKSHMARLLRPKFMEHKLTFRIKKHGRDNFWFSQYDLVNGYILLNKKVDDYTPTHVLPLSDLPANPFTGNIEIKAGEIYPYEKIAHLLKDIPTAWEDKVLLRLIKRKKK